ncbi:MAG: hypothetical protein ACWGO1_01720 [Anaerolineales bacterium]
MTRDLRRYARQTNVRLLFGFIILLFIIGIGLIYAFYGREAAVLGTLCLLFGLAPLVIIWFSLWIIDWLVKRANRE